MFSPSRKFTKFGNFRAAAPIFVVACLVAIGNAQITPTFGGNGPSDPGPRGGTSAAGGPIAGLDDEQGLLTAFRVGLQNFQEVENVAEDGLGPRFNSNSCVSCHIQPAIGGTSPAANPQIQFQNQQNKLPFFIKPNGPAREARFIKKRDGRPDGGVHALFTIGGSRRTVELPYGTGGLLQRVEHHLPDPYANIRLGVG